MNGRFPSSFLMVAMVAFITCLFSQTTTSAQEVTSDKIVTIIDGLPDSEFPLMVIHNYEAGTPSSQYDNNGTITIDAVQELGELNGVTVYDTFVPSGGTGEATTPSAFRLIVKYTKTTMTNEDGSVTVTRKLEIRCC